MIIATARRIGKDLIPSHRDGVRTNRVDAELLTDVVIPEGAIGACDAFTLSLESSTHGVRNMCHCDVAECVACT